MRSYGSQLILHGLAHFQPLNEILNCLLVDAFSRTCQGLQSLVGMWVGFAPQDGLYGLGHYSPAVIQVVVNGVLVQHQFAQSFQGALYADYHMSDGHAYIS